MTGDETEYTSERAVLSGDRGSTSTERQVVVVGLSVVCFGGGVYFQRITSIFSVK